jgi:hypothetical protein
LKALGFNPWTLSREKLVSKFAFQFASCTAYAEAICRFRRGERADPNPAAGENAIDVTEMKVGLSLPGVRLVTWTILAVVN